MIMKRIAFCAALALGWAGAGVAGTVSYTGALSSPEDTFQTAMTMPVAGTATLQTWGFGGGTDFAGTPIPSGGFDPLVAVFSGAGDSATLVNATSDILSNYAAFEGCPPAGTVSIEPTAGTCGDITMSLALTAGSYTVLLSDAAYLPGAVFDNGALGEGFFDLTGGSLPFQTCLDEDDCIDDTTNWALDITTPDQPGSVPEPSTLGLAGLGLLGLALAVKSRSR
jgi:hypothetical protein